MIKAIAVNVIPPNVPSSRKQYEGNTKNTIQKNFKLNNYVEPKVQK